MAKRESQGMQIAVILLVMFSVLLAITTVLFWNQSNKAHTELEQLTASKQQSDSAANKAALENVDLKGLLGHPEGTAIEQVQAQAEKDMALFAQNYPPEKRNYRELPAYQAQTIQTLHQKLNEASRREKELQAQRDQARDEERRDVKVAEENHQTAATDLAQVNEQFVKDLGDLRQRQQSQERQFKSREEALSREVNQLTSKVQGLEAELAQVGRQNDNLNDQIREFRTESFEHPDGRVTWVNQSLRTVYLDLGSSDALRPQATFSVYDVDANNLARVQKKGSIEVRRILGPHLAEAQILEDGITRPIVAGDIVYSPIFAKGRPVHFALAGLLDVDGDGQDDSELVRSLVRLNGGVIDAEVDADGKRSGGVSLSTSYLVIGKGVSEKSNSPLQSELSRIQTEASKAGATIISLGRFLNDIGYLNSSQVVGLGENVDSSQFRPDRRGEGRFRPPNPRARENAVSP